MRVIAQSNQILLETINEFWKGVEGIKPKDLVMDVD